LKPREHTTRRFTLGQHRSETQNGLGRSGSGSTGSSGGSGSGTGTGSGSGSGWTGGFSSIEKCRHLLAEKGGSLSDCRYLVAEKGGIST